MVRIKNVHTDKNFNINEFSTQDGKGVFDAMMASVQKHLWAEFAAQRIRGTDYANAYVDLVGQALEKASVYALARAKLGAELELMQANIDETYAKIPILQEELKIKQAQLLLTQQELDIKQQRLPLELQNLEAQNLKLATDTAVAVKQGGLVDAQADEIRAKIPILHKELKLKAEQLELAKKDQLIKQAQITLAEREADIKAVQLDLTRYELEHKMPAEIKSINAQGDLYAQKVQTEKAQTNKDAIGQDSVIGLQNGLLKEQTLSFARDAKQKAAKILIDAWSIRHNTDPDGNGANEYNKLRDAEVGVAVDQILHDPSLV